MRTFVLLLWIARCLCLLCARGPGFGRRVHCGSVSGRWGSRSEMPAVVSTAPCQSRRPPEWDSRKSRQLGAVVVQPTSCPVRRPVRVGVFANAGSAPPRCDPLVAYGAVAGCASNACHHWATRRFCRRLLWVVVCVVDSRHFISQSFAELAREWVELFHHLSLHLVALLVERGDRE